MLLCNSGASVDLICTSIFGHLKTKLGVSEEQLALLKTNLKPTREKKDKEHFFLIETQHKVPVTCTFATLWTLIDFDTGLDVLNSIFVGLNLLKSYESVCFNVGT